VPDWFTALRLFDLQYRSIPPYRNFCDQAGKTPDLVDTWEAIPAVPTDCFKHFTLFCLPPDMAARTFATSGTSGSGMKGKAHFSEAGLSLMDIAIKINAARMLFPDGRATRILVLAPHPDLAPQMIMAYGMEKLISDFGLEGSGFLVKPGGIDLAGLVLQLRKAESDQIPLTIIGASFGFVNFFEYCLSQGLRFRLPPGSRAMDAGGYKGRSRVVARDEFAGMLGEYLGLPPETWVNLLGMTELASQFYDDVLAAHHQGCSGMRAKVNPPWTRTMVVDPLSLAPLQPKELGFLVHLDLANVERPFAVMTDDLGWLEPTGGFQVLGTASQDEGRGCSITVDELTQAGNAVGKGDK